MSTASPTKSKVYKKQGAQLSEAAQYHAKLKSGVYSNPGKASIGLGDSKTSGAAAALLAAKSDLSIHPYLREPSSDAASAALAAKYDPSIFNSLSKSEALPSHLSASAASAARTQAKKDVNGSSGTSEKSHSIDSSLSASAAKSILSTGSHEHARRHVPENYKHISQGGLVSTPSINYNKLNQKAQRTATGLISSRVQPEKDYRHGLAGTAGNAALASSSSSAAAATKGSLTSSNTINSSSSSTVASSINYSALTSKASRNATSLLDSVENPKRDHTHGIFSAKQEYDASHAASGALASKASVAEKYNKPVVSTSGNYSKVDKHVLAVARANAAKSLQGLEKNHQDRYLYANKDFNEAAIKIAQNRREQRNFQSRDGQYDLGGGLFMPVADVEKIARKFVNPVLDDIEAKAAEQRKLDEEYEAEQARLREEKLQHENELRAKRLEEREERLAERNEHKDELKTEKEEHAQKKKELEDLKEAELSKQREILSELEKKHQLTVEQLEKEKNLENDKQYQELSEFKVAKETELAKLNHEYFEKLQPVIDKLEAENRAYEDLVAEQTALESIAKIDNDKLGTAETLLQRSKAQLEKSENELQAAELGLTKAQTDAEKLTAQSEVNRLRAEVERKITEQKESQAAQKQAFFESERSNQELLKSQKELELKAAAIKALEDEKKYAEIHPGANDNKIKALEAEIRELEIREEQYKNKEERKKFDEAIAKHEETIRGLEEQKRELTDRQDAIIAQLKKSDEGWRDLHEQFEELNVKPSISEEGGAPQHESEIAPKATGTVGDKEAAELSASVVGLPPATTASTTTAPPTKGQEPTSSAAIAVPNSRTNTSPQKKNETFLNKVVTNFSKSSSRQPKEEDDLVTGAGSGSITSPNSASNPSPTKRKRGFSISKLLSKKDSSFSASGTPASAAPASATSAAAAISAPAAIEEKSSTGSTSTPTPATKSTKDTSNATTTTHPGQINSKENNDLKHSFTNFTQGSEVEESKEMDELFGRPKDGKEKAVFTEQI